MTKLTDKKWTKLYEYLRTCDGIYVKNEAKTRCFIDWIKNESNKIIAVENGPITKESRQRLSQVLSKELDRRQRQGAIVDKFMEWQLWVPRQRFVARDTERFPFRYYWNKEIQQWEKMDDC